MNWSLEKLLEFLQRFCVDESITQSDLIDFIRLRYDQIYNDTLDFYRTEGTFALVSGTKYYYLAKQLNLAIKPKFFNQTDDNHPIDICDYDQILSLDSDQSETGTPWKAAFVELSPVLRQPNESSDTGTVGAKSSNASDTSQSVTIAGLRTVSGVTIEDQEEITLTGTTFVSATKTGWHTFRTVSKSDDTLGYVTVSETDGGDTYSVIDPYATNSFYQKWRFWPTSDTTDTIRYTGYRFPVVPQNDAATLDVSPDLVAGFIHGLRADVHDVNFDMMKAQMFEAKFQEAVQKAKENNMWGDGQPLIVGSARQRRYDPNSIFEEVDENTVVI